MLKHRNSVFAVGIAISLIFITLSVRDTDMSAVSSALKQSDLSWAFAFLGFLSLFCVVKAGRWSVLLHDLPNATTRTLLPTILIGYLGTATLPVQLGEVLRAHSAAHRLKSRFTTVLSSLAVERVFDVLGLVLLLAVQMILSSDDREAIWYGGALMAAGALILLAILALAAAKPQTVISTVEYLCRPAPAEWRESILHHVEAAIEGLSVLRVPTKFLELLVFSVVQWVLMWGCVWATLQAFDMNLPVIAPLTVLVAAVMGMLLPAGPGYIGTFQLAFTLTLAPFGVSNVDALAASFFYHIMLWVPLSIAGAICLRKTDFTLKRIMSVDENTGEFRVLQIPDDNKEKNRD